MVYIYIYIYIYMESLQGSEKSDIFMRAKL